MNRLMNWRNEYQRSTKSVDPQLKDTKKISLKNKKKLRDTKRKSNQ